MSTFLLRLIDRYTSKLSADKRSIEYFIGQIPTELGHCSAMQSVYLSSNQLSGTSILCSSRQFGIQVYNNLKKTSLLRRYNPDGAGALHGYDEPQPVLERIDR